MRLGNAIDWHVYGGAALIAGGAAWIYPPAGAIALGMLLLFFVFAPGGKK